MTKKSIIRNLDILRSMRIERGEGLMQQPLKKSTMLLNFIRTERFHKWQPQKIF